MIFPKPLIAGYSCGIFFLVHCKILSGPSPKGAFLFFWLGSGNPFCLAFDKPGQIAQIIQPCPDQFLVRF